jgi:demethylmenaquinone methyltransferase/2-methoxy-6-polyprenyl-1,4-benzoquinol methylase
MSQHVQKLFDTIAPKYDLLNGLLSLKIDGHWRKEAVQKLKEDRFREVLDLCAGTLALTIALLKSNSNAHVTAVDFSKAMLETGEKNLPYGFLSRVDLVVADVLKLKLSPQSYDAVMCAYGMRNLDNNEKALNQIRSLLRPGGRLVVLEFFRPEGILSQVFNLTYAEFVIPALGKLVSKHPNAYHYLRDSVRNFYTPTAYRELLKSIGFENITIKPQSGGISHLITAEVPS